ncbi:hypothetical protein J4E83_001294 [Alternaria metachromatica]|uniref:uncharacterized protein n=1 Tax=Alternaria metachromatica TaxID=283354 RepID=UPI0020C52ECD|nr:uncharacterized protein J4E83_001294 [Alternaria metachromatica]KAI4636340.1 hypothetical protein J4E83_001294 [Alternaria metachromatica]
MPSDAGKGQNFQTSDAKKGNSSNSGGKTVGDKTKFEPMLNCCQFLELPAEIRNRIYHFAEEGVYDDDDDLIRPLLLKRSKVASDSTSVPHLLSTLRYRALTQVCKQIRTEYRPMWLRQSRFCVELPTLAHFISAYYPKVADYQNAPKLLLISWDHGQLGDELEEGYGGDEESMEDVLTNITLLARLRAHCPTFTVNFASRQVLEDDVPNVAYGYLDALDAFLANTNENWLKMLRSTTILQPRVEFTFHVYTQRLTIYIRFLKGQAPKGFKLKSMYNSALGFLNHWGMLDLKASDSIDYVIGEASGKFTRHDGECPSYVSTYNQIHLDSSTIAVWKKEKEAKTQAA